MGLPSQMDIIPLEVKLAFEKYERKRRRLEDVTAKQ